MCLVFLFVQLNPYWAPIGTALMILIVSLLHPTSGPVGGAGVLRHPTGGVERRDDPPRAHGLGPLPEASLEALGTALPGSSKDRHLGWMLVQVSGGHEGECNTRPRVRPKQCVRDPCLTLYFTAAQASRSESSNQEANRRRPAREGWVRSCFTGKPRARRCLC